MISHSGAYSRLLRPSRARADYGRKRFQSPAGACRGLSSLDHARGLPTLPAARLAHFVRKRRSLGVMCASKNSISRALAAGPWGCSRKCMGVGPFAGCAECLASGAARGCRRCGGPAGSGQACRAFPRPAPEPGGGPEMTSTSPPQGHVVLRHHPRGPRHATAADHTHAGGMQCQRAQPGRPRCWRAAG